MSSVGYDFTHTLQDIWQVLLAGLVLGAGLPVVFALGLRALAWGDGGDAEVSHGQPNPIGKVIAGVLFLVVAYGIVSGILYVIASGQGKTITFDHVIPWITKA